MRRLYIPNDFVEWFVIIIGCTVAGLAGGWIEELARQRAGKL